MGENSNRYAEEESQRGRREKPWRLSRPWRRSSCREGEEEADVGAARDS